MSELQLDDLGLAPESPRVRGSAPVGAPTCTTQHDQTQLAELDEAGPNVRAGIGMLGFGGQGFAEPIDPAPSRASGQHCTQNPIGAILDVADDEDPILGMDHLGIVLVERTDVTELAHALTLGHWNLPPTSKDRTRTRCRFRTLRRS